MRGPIFTAQFTAVAVTAGQDLFSLLTDATTRLAIMGAVIGQYSDAGDAQSELLPITWVRANTVAGSGGGAVTPVNLEPWSRAAVTVARINDTTVASGGTPATLISDVFNVQAGYVYMPRYIPREVDERIKVDQSQRICLRLPNAPADSLTMSGTIWFMELGLAPG